MMPQSRDYGSRYNDDGVVIRPGKSTFEINLTGLTKSNARNFADRQKARPGDRPPDDLVHRAERQAVDALLRQCAARWFGPPGGRRAEGVRLGPPGAAVYPGFKGCTQQDFYRDDRGYGWIGADHAAIAYMPDALSGDRASGREFRLKLPDGRYEVNLCWDMFGLSGALTTFHWRKTPGQRRGGFQRAAERGGIPGQPVLRP